MVGMEGRSNREKLRKEAGATVLQQKARRTWFWIEAARPPRRWPRLEAKNVHFTTGYTR